jgi:heptosyltransferase III
VLVLRPGALGDTLLAVPALRALRARFTPLTLAAHSSAARLLVACGEVEHGIAFDDPALGWVFRDPLPRADVPIVAWMDAQALPALGQVHGVVAASRPATDDVHCAAYLLSTLAPLGINLPLDERPLRLASIVESDEVLVHPGSGSMRKNWPAERFAQVIRALDRPVRLIVGEADAGPAASIEAHLGASLARLERPALEVLAAWLAGCHAYIGNDSGVSHLAGLCGARTVALFGPTSPTVWRPLGPNVHVAGFDAPTDAVVRLLLGRRHV